MIQACQSIRKEAEKETGEPGARGEHPTSPERQDHEIAVQDAGSGKEEGGTTAGIKKLVGCWATPACGRIGQPPTERLPVALTAGHWLSRGGWYR